MILGIDLGTTNSSVAVMRDDGPTTLPNELGDHLTPSVVAIAEDGATLVGRAARDRLVAAPRAGSAFFKRDMGTDASYTFGGKRWTPTECSAEVLRELRRVAELNLGQEITRAVVTVPAYFHEPQRRATMQAATIAGLKVEHILNEPTSAALAFGYRSSNEERRLVVFDLGGGTFDVTVLEVFEGIVEVRASGGDSRLGGEDYTDALLELAAGRLGGVPNPELRARLRQRVEVAKRRLWRDAEAPLDWADRRITLTREDVVAACADLNGRLLPILRACLRDAQLESSEVDDVLFVGGSSRLQCVVDLVTELFGRLPNRTLDPDRIVAAGAAIQAARAMRHDAVEDLVMTDVCPHSLGIATTAKIAGNYEPGFFAPILDRNITVPVSRVEPFQTLHPSQDELEIRVFQGEHRKTDRNTLLGSLRIDGLRERPGQRHPGAVDVRFSFDTNGILEVEVTVVETGKKFRRVIESRPGTMTKEEVARAVERLRVVKTRRRDLLPNRARLERANRLFAELTGLVRRELGEAITQFESALEGGSDEELGFARAVLDRLLGAYYDDEGEGPDPEEHDEREPDGLDPDQTDRMDN